MRTTKIAWSKKTKACSTKCCLCGTCAWWMKARARSAALYKNK